MIYRTTLKSVHPPISTDGKRLQFIGNFPCRIGDSVWTDGNVIFGHIPIRSTPFVPIIDDEGVPVLCDGVEGYFALQGYFDLNGNFHEKKLAVSDCFVNDEDNFYPVPSDAWDAEISIDDKGKPDGYRYVVERLVDGTKDALVFFKNGIKEDIFTINKNYRSGLVNIFYELTEDSPYYVSLEQDGNYCILFRHCSYYKINWTGIKIGITIDTSKVELSTFLQTKNGEKQTIVTYSYDGEEITDAPNHSTTYKDNLTYNVVNTLALTQGDYQITYSDKKAYSRDELRFFGSRSYPQWMQPFLPNKFVISSKNDGTIFAVDFPEDEYYRQIHYTPIIKLNGDKFLIGLKVYPKGSDLADQYNALYIYNKKDGLNPVGVGLKNLRLRKMKISKMGG